MTTHLRIPSTITIAAILIAAMTMCNQSGNQSTLTEINKECMLKMSSTDKSDLDSLAGILLDGALKSNDKYMEGMAYLYLSHFEQGLPDSIKTARIKYLDKAFRIAEETANDTLLCRVFNQRGVWEFDNLGNTSTAQYWFSKSIEAAKKTEKRDYAIPAEMNLSETYRLNDDTIGIQYDLELFHYTNNHKNTLSRFSTAFHCATHYAKSATDTSQLKPYIDAMRPLESAFEGSIDYVYALFYYSNGDYEKAEQHIFNSDPERTADLSLLYAKILNHTGRYEESLNRALQLKNMGIGPSRKNTIDLLKLITDNYHQLGDNTSAYYAQKELESYTDSLNEVKASDQTRRYRIEYEVYSKDREISEQRLRNRNLTLWIGAITFFVLATACVTILWIRRRNRLYKDIVRQNRETIEHQTTLTESIARKDAKIQELEKTIETNRIEKLPQSDTPDNSEMQKTHLQISEEKVNSIFDLIQYYCDEKQVWRDTSITREGFADLVGCNRTYFTEVLKMKTGMSYTQYMNSCRIREAIKVLSDKDDDTPLKELSSRLGFLSPKTLFTSFKNATGMSPDRYRKTAREL